MTSIEWTDETWNPIAGCSIISPGCSNCYAMRMAARLEAMGVAKYRGLTRTSGGRSLWTGRVRFDRNSLLTPLRWRKPRKVFVNSMSDLFHDAVSAETIKLVWEVMGQTPQHTYQILTKRPDRMRTLSKTLPLLPNVWLGTSVESQDQVERIKHLQHTRAVTRFISFEPLIARISKLNLTGIAWAIVGGESGPRARAMDQDWVEEILESCTEQGVAFFFKQWGGTNKKKAGRMLRGRTWDEYPSCDHSPSAG